MELATLSAPPRRRLTRGLRRRVTLVQVAGYNLGLLMRALVGAGTPKAAADACLVWFAAGERLLLVLLLCPKTGSAAAGSATPAAFVLVTVTPDDGAL